VPGLGCVGVVYDQSVLSEEVFVLSGLRMFDSVGNNRLECLLCGGMNEMQCCNDIEIYVVNDAGLIALRCCGLTLLCA